MKGIICSIRPVVMLVLLWLNGSVLAQGPSWVDQQMASMSLEEKIGQLFMLATFSNREAAHEAYIERMIRQQHLGGLIFMQGTAERQRMLAERYQKASKVPLLIAQDAEWGLAMRIKQVPRFPYQMTLGAIRNDSLIYYVGKHMAQELKTTGINTSFSPVADINNNARNPVINYRSFGENKYNVARKSIMLSQGLQGEGVMACAKHFPGHGDTDADSHYDLPVLYHSKDRLDTLELYPFVHLARSGVQSMMVAHLFIPSLDDTPNQASTLSPKIVTDLLRERMGFQGLIFTDALNMQGVAKYYSPGEVALKAFEAGNDILLFPQNIPLSARLIKEAVESGRINREELDARVRRILQAKYRLRLHQRPAPPANLWQTQIASPENKALRKQLYEAAMTLVKNDRQILPLRHLESRKIAYVQIGGGSGNAFDQSLRKYAPLKRFYLRKNFTSGEKERLLQRLKGFNTVIIGVLGMSQRASSQFGITRATRSLCQELAEKPYETVLTLFGNPYSLQYFGEQNAILMAYEPVAEAQQAAAAAIFGGIRVDGSLPITASEQFPEGTGLVLREPIRFGFAIPEEEGMDSEVLGRMETLAQDFIKQGAMPGCAVLVLKGNRIVYDRGFGRMEYLTHSTPVDPLEHTYDLASITKVAATTLLTMHLVESGRLKLDEPISTYLPELKGTNKAALTIRRLLQHNAGLKGWVPFYQETLQEGKERKTLDPHWYSFEQNQQYSSYIAPGLFGRPSLKDLVWRQIIDLEVRKTSRVRYSDIGFIVLMHILERETGRSLDWLCENLFYRPLGMDHTYFQPHLKGEIKNCPPTEADTLWRSCVVQGYVHDPAAALMGGVSGHAGLFSNVYDLGKLMLMLKNNGTYGGQRYFSRLTIDRFTSKQLSYSRRGLGFDKPELENSRNRRNPVSEHASRSTYGHTGFTGTCVWVDPTFDIVYVFLANRTYPWPRNRALIYEHVREKLMDQIYESMAAYRVNYGAPLEWRHSTAKSPMK
jgi:beta-N-acetylhexosaminidase